MVEVSGVDVGNMLLKTNGTKAAIASERECLVPAEELSVIQVQYQPICSHPEVNVNALLKSDDDQCCFIATTAQIQIT